MGDPLNKPNVVIPLAASYDTRGIDARTNMEAGEDQRKVNCYYDVIRNSVTGNTTLELVKRPGVSLSSVAQLSGGSGGQYLLFNLSGSGQDNWGIYTDGTTVRAYGGSTNGTILVSSSFGPSWGDTTTISGVNYAVVQLVHNAGSAQRVFYASAVNSWTEISDATFTGIFHVGKAEHMDGYMFIADATGKIYNSDLNSLANWTDGNFITKQIKQDTTLGLAKFKNMILAFGYRTVEVFRNVGNPSGSPLSTIKELASDVGMGYNAVIPSSPAAFEGNKHYYCVVGERMYFIGAEGHSAGNGVLMSFDGQRFEKVSTGSMDKILKQNSSLSVHKIHMYGRIGVGIRFNGVGDQKGLIYFPDVNDWFEWTSSKFQLINNGIAYANATSSSSAVYGFSPDTENYADDGAAYTMSIQFKVPKKGNNRDFMRWCALDADTTRSASNVTVKFSDDDYQTFDAGRTIDLNTLEKRIMRCGSYKNRVVRLEHSANTEFRARNFLARVD